ncbi:MAG: TerC family protein [Desulfobacteraceae bacterium]|nr:TerC family protein [Desulfobacteraceae bacterium]
MIDLAGMLAGIARDAQSFEPVDGLTVLTLAALEGILSVDNSLVLAILVRSLPKEQQKKALAYGILGAFFFRIVAILFAAYLIQFTVFKLVGGAYLIYLAMKHMFFFYKEEAHQLNPRAGANFWRTVTAVELTDVAFAIDSITAAVAMTNKLLIVWLGGVLGIVFLRFLAGFLVRLLEKLPKLEDLAYQLIFFIGTKLFLDGLHVKIEHTVFWMMMGVIVILGSALVYRDYHQRESRTRHHHILLEKLRKGEMEVEELLRMEYIPREVIEYLLLENCLFIAAPGPGGTCDGRGSGGAATASRATGPGRSPSLPSGG